MNAGARRALRGAVFQYQARDERPKDRLDRLAAALKNVGRDAIDLVVCPELFLSGYNIGSRVADLAEPTDGPFGKGIAALALEYNTAILYGYPERDSGRCHNAAACFDADGRLIANHRKLRLPNEYEQTHFACGEGFTYCEIAGWKIGVLVCYDIEFPESVRACALGGAEIVVAPTALKAEWSFVARRMIPTRAFENGVFVVYANYAGQEGEFTYLGESCVIGPDGSELARGGSGEEMLQATLDASLIAAARAKLPYLRDRNAIPRV
ncbi:MAG: carbon-nitrogen hydrolase family protein [Rhodospirillaceae bacterium]|nr:carbon-nitrogen hydrolase family protein [Rhodospirillaceae bacterium]